MRYCCLISHTYNSQQGSCRSGALDGISLTRDKSWCVRNVNSFQYDVRDHFDSGSTDMLRGEVNHSIPWCILCKQQSKHPRVIRVCLCWQRHLHGTPAAHSDFIHQEASHHVHQIAFACNRFCPLTGYIEHQHALTWLPILIGPVTAWPHAAPSWLKPLQWHHHTPAAAHNNKCCCSNSFVWLWTKSWTGMVGINRKARQFQPAWCKDTTNVACAHSSRIVHW